MSDNSAAPLTPFQVAQAQSATTTAATQNLLCTLLGKNVTIPEALLTKVAAISTKPGMDSLAVAVAQRKDLSAEIAENLAADTRLDVRRAYISAPVRTADEIRAAIASEKRPTALGDIIEDKETSEAVVEVLAERDSTLLAMKVLERKSSSSRAVILALSTIDKAKRSLTWQASSNLKASIRRDHSIAQHIADTLNRTELLSYSEQSPLTPESFYRIAELLVTQPLSKTVKLKSTQYGYEYAGEEIAGAISSARSLMNNLDLPPALGVKIADTCALAIKKMGPGGEGYQTQLESAMNKFTSLDVDRLATLPKLTPAEIELAEVSDDAHFLEAALLAAELMFNSFIDRAQATAAALIVNKNLPKKYESRALEMIGGNDRYEPLHKLHQLTFDIPSDLTWVKRRMVAIILAYPELAAHLPSLDSWLIDTINNQYAGEKEQVNFWHAALRSKSVTQYLLLNAPWELLINNLGNKQHAEILASLLNSRVSTPDRWSIFDQLQGGFKGTTGELLETVTSLAG